MQLLTNDIRTQLLKNDKLENVLDIPPVVKFFTPDAACTWLISSMDADGRMFGLCDLGMAYPELGSVMLDELESVRGRFGLPVERDRFCSLTKTLREYVELADRNQHITL